MGLYRKRWLNSKIIGKQKTTVPKNSGFHVQSYEKEYLAFFELINFRINMVKGVSLKLETRKTRKHAFLFH